MASATAARLLAPLRSRAGMRMGAAALRRPSTPARAFTASSLRPEKWYSEEHEWIDISSDGKSATIGITTYAAKALGDVVFVDLPAGDLIVKAGDPLGAVESVKSASDIYAPAGGKVTKANGTLEDSPANINKSPEGDGWIAEMELDEGEADRVRGALMNQEKYEAFTNE